MESVYCFQNAKNGKELALCNKKKWQYQEIWWKGFVKSDSFRLQVAQFRSVESLSRVRLFATSWIAARQASLSITNSWSSHRVTSIQSVMPSSHLIRCHPLLLLPPIPPSIRVFSNESTLRMKWPKWFGISGVSASASVLPVNTQDWSPLGRTSWISLQSKIQAIRLHKPRTIHFYTSQSKAC